jgi:hypothetical protein
LNGLPLEDYTHFNVIAGEETVDWFREHLPKQRCRFSVDVYPWRCDEERRPVTPHVIRATGIGRVSTINKRWVEAPHEKIWAYSGSTLYAAIFDRETKQIVFCPDMKLC